MSDQSTTILVFEKRSRWTPELKRQFAGHDVTIRGCRSVADLEARLQSVPGGIAVLDIEVATEDCLQFLGRIAGRFPRPLVVAIASPGSAALEWPMRELGVLEFAIDPTGEELARLCRRQTKISKRATKANDE